jgi:predicted aspartyl protease
MKIHSRPYIQNRSPGRLPKLKLILSGPTGRRVEAIALIDTGSSATIIPTRIAKTLQLQAGDAEKATVANGETMTSYVSNANIGFQCPTSERCFVLQQAEILISGEFLILGFDVLSVFQFGFSGGQVWFEPPVDQIEQSTKNLPRLSISD